jgi:hypothetical protein
MSEPSERLKEARRRAGLAGPAEAAKKFGWNPNTYKSHENGERGIRQSAAERYARRLRVSPAWLLGLTNEGGPANAAAERQRSDFDQLFRSEASLDEMPLDQTKLVMALAAAEKILEDEELTDRAAVVARLQGAIYEFLISEEKRGQAVDDDLVLRIASLIRRSRRRP